MAEDMARRRRDSMADGAAAGLEIYQSGLSVAMGLKQGILD